MAEAIGLILGIAGLYSACIDAFESIRAARSFGRDYEILSTRFDVRKARLLQWGDGVGLLHEPQDGRNANLDSPSLRPAVERVLHCIKMLLTDTENLRSKYGLEEVAAVEEPHTYTPAIAIVSCRRRDLFKASYSRFQARIRRQQKDSSLNIKTQWAIKGRKEFENLISDLEGLIEDLYKLVPVTPDFKRLMVKEDIGTLPEDLAALKLVQEACSIDASGNSQDIWLEAASVRVEATELGTSNRRRINEWLLDTTSGSGEHDVAPTSSSLPHAGDTGVSLPTANHTELSGSVSSQKAPFSLQIPSLDPARTTKNAHDQSHEQQTIHSSNGAEQNDHDMANGQTASYGQGRKEGTTYGTARAERARYPPPIPPPEGYRPTFTFSSPAYPYPPPLSPYPPEHYSLPPYPGEHYSQPPYPPQHYSQLPAPQPRQRTGIACKYCRKRKVSLDSQCTFCS